MYRIEQHSNHLLVRFYEDLDFSTVQVVIHHLMRMKEYPDTNDIWFIGAHRLHIRLGDIETMVEEFQCHCPKDSNRSRTAIGVDNGLARSFIALWVKALRKRVSFEMSIFDSLEEARVWISAADEQVA